MIKLEHVSTLEFLEWDLENHRALQAELMHEHILDYQRLKDFLENYDGVNKWFLTEELFRVEKSIAKFNRKGKEPKFYSTPGYPDEALGVTDMYATGADLILRNPTRRLVDGTRHYFLLEYYIIELKFMMQHTDLRGDNLFSKIKRVGGQNIETVLDAIRMYEEQVIRQSKETPEREINLFDFQYAEKRELVEENLGDIVSYLIDHTKEELVWGKLTDSQKKLLVSSVVNQTKRERLVYERLSHLLASYTTLSELENGITKGKTLHRFIKK